jgi:hypothetical protein
MKSRDTRVHNSSFHSIQNVEATHASTSGWMSTQNVVYPHTKLFCLKGKEMPTHATVWVDLKTFILSEISQAQKVRYSGSTLSCLEQSSSWRQTVEWVARAGRGMLGVSVWCGGFGFREMSSSGDEQWLDCSMLWMCLKMVKMSQAQWHTAVILALYWGRRIGSSRPTWAT